jgi:exonuclease III
MTSQGSSVIVAVTEQRPERNVGVVEEDRMDTKEDGVVRIGFNNINGLGTQPNDIKNRQVYSFLHQYEFDMFGMVETNVHWLKSKISPKDIMQEWFQRQHISYAYYKDYPVQSKFQVGGVLQIAIGRTSSRIIEHGNDNTGQGRWSWQKFSGKEQRALRVVTVYRPVRNTQNPGSAWHQQQYYADNHECQGNPHDRWIGDLQSKIQEWIQQGDSMIVMGDFNEDVRRGNTIRTLKQLGLVDVWQGKEQPPTFQRGSVPIDTILVTPEIYPEKSGYIRSMSDHLCLWLDIKATKLFERLNHPIPAARRRLQCNDPRIVQKYNNQLWSLVQEKKICSICVEGGSQYERLGGR